MPRVELSVAKQEMAVTRMEGKPLQEWKGSRYKNGSDDLLAIANGAGKSGMMGGTTYQVHIQS